MAGQEQQLAVDGDVYKTLLESTKAIPWRLDWKSMRFTYIGPQIESLLGWSRNSWVSIDDWIERIHEDDRDFVVNFCVTQSQSGVDHEADYRAITQDGRLVWIRDVVHVVREHGEVVALTGFMFDISERKAQEEALFKLQRELEELSFKDGLTDVANRRMFDLVLDREWASARRNQAPLSLALVDIDFFKHYNDHYGHVKGDDCLKRVATLLSTVVTRPRDLVARFGGEEFALVLPETDGESARMIAERCRQIIHEEMIPHGRSPIGVHVSVSVGVGTHIPGEADGPQTLIEAVDRMLYRAKQQGRDRVSSTLPDRAPGETAAVETP